MSREPHSFTEEGQYEIWYGSHQQLILDKVFGPTVLPRVRVSVSDKIELVIEVEEDHECKYEMHESGEYEYCKLCEVETWREIYRK